MSEPSSRNRLPRPKLTAVGALTAFGALVVPLSLFLTWFQITTGANEGDYTGWYSFHRTDRVLAVLALAAVATAVLPPSRRIAVARVLLGILAIVVVGREVVSPPVIGSGMVLGSGAYLGLAGSLLVGIAGLLSFDGVGRLGRVTLRRVAAREWGSWAQATAVVFRGVPNMSAEAFGLFRIAFGFGLIWAVVVFADLPRRATLIAARHRDEWFFEAEWVKWLADSSGALHLVEVVTVVALLLFVLGLFTRIAYTIAVLGVATTALVIAVRGGVWAWGLPGAHAWGLPTVTALCLLVVPWGSSGFSLDALRRRRRGGPSAEAPSCRYGLAVWIPGLTVGVACLAAAYAKLSLSGLEWITGGAVKYHFIEDASRAPVDWGLRLTSVDGVAVLMSLSGVMIEATFILVLLSARPGVRLVFGLAGASLLTGFFLFQGVFWAPWWVLLLAFLPWEGIHRLGRQLAHRAPRGPTATPRAIPLSGSLRMAATALVVVLVAQQVVVSATRLEELPFLSNYPMYSDTWESEEAFNAENSKFVEYRFEANGPAGRRVDVTSRVAAIGSDDALVDAFEAREARDLNDSETQALQEDLRQLDSRYHARYGEGLGRVWVIAERTAGFDFERGEFDRRIVDRTSQVVEPAKFEVAFSESG